MLDAGPTAVGVKISIVACLGGARLLRPGGVPRAALEAAIGQALVIVEEGGAAPIAPGLLASHYAPRAVRLDAGLPYG